MSEGDTSTILVPVDVSSEELPATGIFDLLGTVDVVLLGYYPVPNQAAPAQLKQEYEAQAADRLEAIGETLPIGSGELTDVLVFTHDERDTIDRIAEETGADAVLSPGVANAVDRVLVPLRGDSNIDRILDFVVDLVRAGETTVTVFHSADGEDGEDHGDSLLDDGVEFLETRGIDRDRIERRLSDREDTSVDIVDLSDAFDVVVIGETEPSLRERILGSVPSAVITQTDKPVFVVRRPADV